MSTRIAHENIAKLQLLTFINRSNQRMTVIRTAQHRAHAQEQPFPERRHDRHLQAEPVGFARLTVDQPPQLRRMRRVALAFVPGLLRRNPLGLARLVHSANAVRLGGKRSSGRSGGDTAPDGACGGHANATQHTIQPSGLRRRWRWELSYRRITALFDLRGRKDAVTGWERRYRERRATRMRGCRANGHRKPRGSKPANGKRSHATRSGPSNMFISPPCK